MEPSTKSLVPTLRRLRPVAMLMQKAVSERSEGWFSSGDCRTQGVNEPMIDYEYVG